MSISDIAKNIINEVKLAVVNRAGFVKGYIKAKSQLGGSTHRIISSATIQPDAGDYCETKTVYDIGTVIQGLDSTEDNVQLVIDQVYVHYQLFSSSPYIYTPVLLLLENGEVLTRQTGSEVDPEVDIDAGVSGMYALKLGPFQVSNKRRETGSHYYANSFTHDLTEECKEYTRQMNRNIINEQTIKELLLAYHVYEATANIQIYLDYYLVIDYHLRKISPNTRF